MDRPIAIVAMSGTRERLQMAGMLAALGVATGTPVRVFVAMNALPCFRVGTRCSPQLEGPIGAALDAATPPFERLFADAVELGDAKMFPCSLAMELARVTP